MDIKVFHKWAFFFLFPVVFFFFFFFRCINFPNLISPPELNLDTVRVKMQHLTVTSLASSCNRLPYSVVAEALDIEVGVIGG